MEQADSTNQALFDNPVTPTGEEFVAGLLARVDLRTGTLAVVNAGHVPPYLLRDGALGTVEVDVNLPLGMFPDTRYTSTSVQLRPGDRLLFVTDGMLERGVASLDLPAAIRATRGLHPREAVRALADSALRTVGGDLQDDATVMCLDWHGSHGDPRLTVAGAETARASRPLG